MPLLLASAAIVIEAVHDGRFSAPLFSTPLAVLHDSSDFRWCPPCPSHLASTSPSPRGRAFSSPPFRT